MVTDKQIADAVALAKQSEVVILSVATNSGEGYDRANLTLGASQVRR